MDIFMKKLIIILILVFSCSDAEIIQNCDCGIITNLGKSGNCWYIGLENECTGNFKNVCYDHNIQEVVILGQRFCDKKFNY